ncbi:hypothetical protein [Stakelama pacifica]|uniref:Uncharacterized protein n=1 Tax=Stakelama pacifica TaxID=517720 RepID=A0A4R6FR88_9SPHN|nr:hypothetical protein [Stakelama pacifica]TDN83650.1 hypothetical protein EV664_104134 [Stakelama pacifica]GGO94431.1 hypothetical protein GCM10011329_16230 [Stakelama pacifica]
MDRLRARILQSLDMPVGRDIREAAALLAQRRGGCAVLFYGSVLRTGDMDGVLDFYVLTPGRSDAMDRLIWPHVSFAELPVSSGRIVRAKVATMPLDIFGEAAAGEMVDTTIWTRFVQPSALVWVSDWASRRAVEDAICSAAMTAASFAAMLGEEQGSARDYWGALFRQTYTLELRVEKPGRERQILDNNPQWFDDLLPLAWDAAGIAHDRRGAIYAPRLAPERCRRLFDQWVARQKTGKWLNAARLLKAGFTFEGATRYALWKIERHTGIGLRLTPWRERHPVLAAPGVLFQLWRRTATK